jgi:hypothetical protein
MKAWWLLEVRSEGGFLPETFHLDGWNGFWDFGFISPSCKGYLLLMRWRSYFQHALLAEGFTTAMGYDGRKLTQFGIEQYFRVCTLSLYFILTSFPSSSFSSEWWKSICLCLNSGLDFGDFAWLASDGRAILKRGNEFQLQDIEKWASWKTNFN